MIIAQTERSTYLDVSKIDWEATKYPGVSTKTLYRDAAGRQTTLTRMAPGARLPKHRHVGIEPSFVLEGTLVDGDGQSSWPDYSGSWVRSRTTTSGPTPSSSSGASSRLHHATR
jgi:hypothetical protein